MSVMPSSKFRLSTTEGQDVKQSTAALRKVSSRLFGNA